MNNRLIYILISLMLISLVGIIWIQTSWIGDAIAEQEQDFEVRVNEALNVVNDSIDSEEVELFLKQEFGGIDSMVNDIIMIPDIHDQSIVEINVQRGEDDSGMVQDEMMIIRSTKEERPERVAVIKDSVKKNSFIIKEDSLKDSLDGYVWSEHSEVHFEDKDSLKEDNKMVFEKRHRVESMMQRFTFETLLTGELKDRIDPKDLKKKIKTALQKEGIYGAFHYAVKNEKEGVFETDYMSSNFDTTDTRKAFTKPLFQSDRRKRMNYTLLVQPEDSSNFIWSQVWKMTALSVAFTLLILLSFGYALYFIFKQKRISQVKNDFINNMTHELKTPLASISLATASIKHPEIVKNPEEIRRLIQLIEDEKDRINTHVERVLDTAALDSGELKLSIDHVNIVPILKQAVKNVEMSLVHVNGTIQLSENEEIMVRGDGFHLTNVFTNILDNGIKYRSEVAPKIMIRLHESKDVVEVMIEDNGIGMTAKQQKHAFDKFYRAETGDIHNRKGFGLGLSYVKSVIEKHSGKVSMESKPNEGTVVTVQIPKV
ncbi:MAG: HAMP domain-containing sensor histidine kinase [Crocinitomicaceae bacterium]